MNGFPENQQSLFAPSVIAPTGIEIARRRGRKISTNGYKWSICGERKPVSEFRPEPKRNKAGISSRCKDCKPIYDRERVRTKRPNRNPYKERNQAREIAWAAIRHGQG